MESQPSPSTADPRTVHRSEWLGYAAALILCLGFMTWALQLWKANLRVPFAYSGDNLVSIALTKGTLDNPWHYENRFLGAPFISELYDFPILDNWHLLVLKLLALASGDAFIACNLYFLLTFPLTTFSALAVFRQFRASRTASVIGALLYTFLPYHYMRFNTGHLYLSAYYFIPPTVLLILWVAEPRPLASLRRRLAAGLICLLVSSSGVYYAFFACFFLAVAGLQAVIAHRAWRGGAIAAGLISLIVAGCLLNGLLPLLHRLRDGANPELNNRSSEDAEIYALKLTEMLLPVDHHRSFKLARLKAYYHTAARPLVNENTMAALGLFGAFGFLLLIAASLTVIPSPDRLLTRLSGLNLAGVLLGMGGGLGALFNFLIYANIRAYNRISVYLAFFCLFAVVLVLDRLLAWARSRNLSIPAYSLCAAGLVFGVWDECVKPMVQPYDQTALPFKTDQRFVRDIERQLGPDAAVFQLPVVRYPEASCQFHMVDYGHLRGYLHSKTLRWSFGLVPGREGLLWQQETAARPVPDMVRSLALAGFRGLYIDRQGYADSAAALEYQLTAFLAVEPHVSADGLRSFFSLASYADHLHTSMTSESWTAARAAVLETPHALYLDGFHASEVFVDNPPHWCRPRGELLLINPSDRPRTVTLNMICRTDRPVPFPLTLTGLLPTETFPINNQPTLRTWTLSLPPGRHKIHLACAAPVDYIPARPGHVFFITDLSVTEVNPH